MSAPRPHRPFARAALLALLAASCAAPAERARAPFTLELRHFAGTPRTGPLPAPLDAGADAGGATLVARVEARWLEEPAPQLVRGGEPLLPERVLVEGLGDFLGLAGELARGARLVRPAPAGLGACAGELRALVALLEGATAVVALAPAPPGEPSQRGASYPGTPGPPPAAPRPAWSRLELELARPGAGEPPELALVLVAPGGSARERERLVLPGAPEPEGPAWALWVPAPGPGRPRAVLALEVALRRVPEPSGEVLAARERAEAELARARREAERDASPLAPAEGLSIQTASALDALARRGLGRQALFHLAQATDAPLAAELALRASAPALEDLRAELAGELAAGDARELPAAELGWRIEGAAWRWLAGRALAEDSFAPEAAPLAPELVALLLREAGTLGRQPDLLLDALEGCGAPAELERVLVEENRIALESSDPAERVRAHDWLTRRGLALEGYDPLAARGARRAALRRATEASAGEPEGAR